MMPKITTETKKGKLSKVNGKWFVISAGSSGLPIYELEDKNEQLAVSLLLAKFNTTPDKLEGMEVDWKYIITDGVTNFGYEYAMLW
jgi:hypothetical protein